MSSAPQHVLVVDDEEAIVYVFERYLSIAGHRVSVALSGEDAVRAFAQAPADVLITDFRMPGMNGVELIHHLRRSAPLLPALIISANPVEVGSLPAGVRFFRKPVAMEGILDFVNAASSAARP